MKPAGGGLWLPPNGMQSMGSGGGGGVAMGMGQGTMGMGGIGQQQGGQGMIPMQMNHMGMGMQQGHMPMQGFPALPGGGVDGSGQMGLYGQSQGHINNNGQQAMGQQGQQGQQVWGARPGMRRY
jgi:hypothetical protein